MDELHIVVGAGPIGLGVVDVLVAAGRQVRVVTRSGSGPDHPLVERVALDAADPALADLAEGGTAIYNCVNPQYHRWTTDWPPIAANLLSAATGSGAVLATCSNLYLYGPVNAPMTEQNALAATGSKGRVRARMWLDALAAHRAGRARITEVRGSDYVGARSRSHLGDQVVPRLLRGRSARVMGDPDTPHTWTYTRDMARTLVVAAATEAAWGRAWHAPSNEPVPARQAVAELCRVAGVPQVRVSPIPGWALTALALVSPQIREFGEVRHQTTKPWVMDSTAAQREFGLQPTPWPEVLADVVEFYRARSGQARSERRAV
jgi:nucleoside-diphosphate-sugar epimerase